MPPRQESFGGVDVPDGVDPMWYGQDSDNRCCAAKIIAIRRILNWIAL